MDKTIIKAIDVTLNEWSKLDPKHKGSLYGDAVNNLIAWKKELECKYES